MTGLSILIGIAIKLIQRTRTRTQNEYADLDRLGEISLEPFVSNEQLGRDALGSSPSSSNQEINNQTESTLVQPPSQETTLNFSNVGYKSASSSGLSTDTDEFRSLNDTVRENSSPPSPASSPTSEPTVAEGEKPSSAEEPSPAEEVAPTKPRTLTPDIPRKIDSSSPLGSSPQSSSTPIVDRIKGLAKGKQRKRVSQSDPTRIMPRRAAKKNVNYKE